MMRTSLTRHGMMLAAFAAAVPLFAQQAKAPASLDRREKLHGAFRDRGGAAPLAAASGLIPNAGDWARFQSEYGAQNVMLDPQTGRIASVAGRIPWIPGPFNTLTRKDIAAYLTAPDAAVGIPELDRIARAFIAKNAAIFRIPAGVTYDLNPAGSVEGSPNSNLWHLRYDLSYNGVPIQGGALLFVVKHGNLILWGTEGLDDVGGLPPLAPRLTAENALGLVDEYVGGFLAGGDSLAQPPALVIVPERDGAAHGYRRIWEVQFERQDEGSYLARVDADSGEIAEFRDITEYAQVSGGIYPVSNTGAEVVRPFGFANYGTSLFADAGGTFPYTSGTVTSTLNGKYVRVSDACGATSLSASASPGDLNFGSSSGTDCVTPGIGGAGNTHSSRSCYYHVDLIKQKGRWYYPTNTWLQAQLTTNVNINATCNANWNGSTLNFYRSGGGCGNTGELAAVFLHEWGHGMDSNDGNGAGGSGEAMGDTVAMLQVRNSCIGDGFFLTSNRGCGQQGNGNFNCSGYGNCCSNCSGVRDQDRAKHAINRIITPANIATACTTAGGDPCGREVHCEGQMPANTVWDLVQRDLPAARGNGAPDDNDWAQIDKFWWVSGPTRNAAYTCANKTGPGATGWGNGCGASSWFETFRAADDDDGNLANGTPHGATLFAAFDRHGISCGLAGDAANSTHTICPAIGSVGTITGAAGNNTAVISWNVASNAASYVVSRNNSGCGFGFTPIATVSPGAAVTYSDTAASNGTTWYYNVQALGTNTDCTGPISNCVAVTPAPCTAPGTPAIGTATLPGANQINVSWSQGAPASAKFNVYRGTGACAGATFSKIASGLAAAPTNYTDGAVQGGFTYAYKVTGTDASGSCESAQTGCVQQTATGSCALAPTFAGLTSASNSAQAACTVGLGWSSGSKICPLASGTLTYNIYRSTSSGFTPAVANRIATGVSGTSYSDTGTLSDRTPYYYIVHAVDSLGNEDGNLAQQSTAPTGAVTGPTTYTSTDVPKSIPDANAAGASSVITVAGNASLLTDLNVTMNVTHPKVGQLTFTLIAPDATTVALVTKRGGNNANFTNTVFDDSALTAISAGTAPFTGSFKPESPLTAVNNLVANGTWSLHGVDSVNGQPTNGTITGWSMAVTAAGVCSSAGCLAPSGLGAPAATDPSICGSGITVSWAAPAAWGDTSGTRTWTVLRDGAPVVSGPCSGALPGATLTCVDAPGDALAHTYRIKAINGCGSNLTSAASASISDVSGSAPSGLLNNTAADTAVCAYSGNTVTWDATGLSWNDNGSGARTWTVLRDGVTIASGGCSGALPETTLTCNDTTAIAATVHTYTVTASNGCALNTTTAGATATDDGDIAAPAMTPQSLGKTATLDFTWNSAEAGATYTTYSSTTLPASWLSRNTTASLAWSNPADLGDANSYFYSTTAKDACNNESPQ